MAEIELKFICQDEAIQAFDQAVVPALSQLGMSISTPRQLTLQNTYYDTSEHDFQQRKIGFRVRGCDGRYEQTLKTQGTVRGGLHERAEHNIDLPQAEPDLTLFDASVWPRGLRAADLNARLQAQFSTHFTRTVYDIKFEGSEVELVLDVGQATTDKAESPICEIELELKAGPVAALFDIAEVINSILPVRVSDVSKAAQGYQLLNGVTATVRPLPEVLPLPAEVATEKAFIESAQLALAHWQYHEHMYLQTGSLKMLAEVATAVRLLLQCVSLYLPVLQCNQLLELHRQLMHYVPRWAWQDDLQSLRYVVSKKSLFNKCLTRYPAVQSYLQGRKAGMLQAHDPQTLLFDTESTAIKLATTRLLNDKPWQQESTTYAMPVIEHAKGWLSQGWQTVQQSMVSANTTAAANYIAVEVVLRQTLLNGFLLADLFNGEWRAFRAPWLDILTGIDELKALILLNTLVSEAEVEEREAIASWVKDKKHSLLVVMDRTRQVGMQGDTYW